MEHGHGVAVGGDQHARERKTRWARFDCRGCRTRGRHACLLCSTIWDMPTVERTLHGTLHGTTALVTGGSRGIGRAICLRLAAQGANIILHYHRNRPAAEGVAE